VRRRRRMEGGWRRRRNGRVGWGVRAW